MHSVVSCVTIIYNLHFVFRWERKQPEDWRLWQRPVLCANAAYQTGPPSPRKVPCFSSTPFCCFALCWASLFAIIYGFGWADCHQFYNTTDGNNIHPRLVQSWSFCISMYRRRLMLACRPSSRRASPILQLWKTSCWLPNTSSQKPSKLVTLP